MGQLTTHVLDTSIGMPAAGVRIDLHEITSQATRLIRTVATGRDGRCAAPLLVGDEFRSDRYLLTFYLADYFRTRGVVLPEPAFIEEVVVRIGIAYAEQHYHVPLLMSPWSYSLYRGG